MMRLAMLLAFLPSLAWGATCAPRQTVIDALEGQFSETRTGAGLAANGALVEVFTSASGSWTITATHADQVTCLVASGQSWEIHTAPPLGEPG